MSRIGNRKLTLPTDVTINIDGKNITVTGPKGSLKLTTPNLIQVKAEGNIVETVRKNEIKSTKQLHGTINSLINNMIIGVNKGYQKVLEINGVGYRAAVKGSNVELSVGYSHIVILPIPEGVKVEAPTNTKLVVSGIDKQKVGELAAKIRAVRKPEPYKGKGIKYQEEHIIRKEGKSAGK